MSDHSDFGPKDFFFDHGRLLGTLEYFFPGWISVRQTSTASTDLLQHQLLTTSSLWSLLPGTKCSPKKNELNELGWLIASQVQNIYINTDSRCVNYASHTFGLPTVVKSLSFSPGIPTFMACSTYPIPLEGIDGPPLCLLGLPDGQISSKLGTIWSPLKANVRLCFEKWPTS